MIDDFVYDEKQLIVMDIEKAQDKIQKELIELERIPTNFKEIDLLQAQSDILENVLSLF
ncbi:MAG: hypothetical protein WC827_04710 [Candidatus Paceibacterota bacterium]|jgi:hypothetical protein